MLAMHLHHLVYVAAGTTNTLHIQNLGALTYGLAAIGPGIERQLSTGERPGEAEQRAPARLRHREPVGIRRGERLDRREDMGHRSERALQRLPVFGDQAPGERPRAPD